MTRIAVTVAVLAAALIAFDAAVCAAATSFDEALYRATRKATP